jgi:hypothetical protein
MVQTICSLCMLALYSMRLPRCAARTTRPVCRTGRLALHNDVIFLKKRATISRLCKIYLLEQSQLPFIIYINIVGVGDFKINLFCGGFHRFLI